MKAHPTGRQQGFALLLLIGIILAVAAGAIGTYAVMRSRDKTAQTQNETATTQSSEGDKNGNPSGLGLSANQRNTARRVDANKVLAAVGNFYSNNTGYYPDRYEDEEFRGSEGSTPEALTDLEWYKKVGFASGAQQPVRIDAIRVVPGATCKDDGGTVVGAARSLAVQYSLEARGDAYTPKCEIF
jgi:hypothetical protein